MMCLLFAYLVIFKDSNCHSFELFVAFIELFRYECFYVITAHVLSVNWFKFQMKTFGVFFKWFWCGKWLNFWPPQLRNDFLFYSVSRTKYNWLELAFIQFEIGIYIVQRNKVFKMIKKKRKRSWCIFSLFPLLPPFPLF